MNKLISYIIAILGIVAIALSFNSAVKAFLDGMKLPLAYLMILGIVLVVIGIAFSFSKKIKKQEEEVPIFEGEGKKRRIVGYRKMKK